MQYPINIAEELEGVAVAIEEADPTLGQRLAESFLKSKWYQK